MRTRRLLEHVELQRLTVAVSPAGTKSETWTAIATVRAELLRRSLNERLEAFGEAEESTLGFRLYTVPGVEITTADRVTWKGKVLNIVDVQDVPRGRLRVLEIICKQVTA